MRKPLISLTAALLLIISLIAVSCAPAQMQDSGSDTIYVYFGNLEAKAVDETAYSSEGKVENGTSSVTIGDVNDYYWAYSAVKADNLFTEGATYQKGGTQTFANCAEGTGLGNARPFSKGAWTFELRAYASVADRNAGTQYLFSGKTTTESLTTATKVAIPVTYSYIAGKGTASFTISTEVKQDTLSGYDTYKITGVNAIIDGTTTVALSDSDNDGKWTGTKTELASGVKTIGLEVFVDSESTARASTDKLTSAIILHGMTTEISGKATVTLTGATMQIDFNGTSLPSEQPKILTKAASTIAAGNILTMGKNKTTSNDLKWLVLDVDSTNNRALVVYAGMSLFSMKPYADGSGVSSYSWSTCDINTYLNGSFLSEYSLDGYSLANVEHSTLIKTNTETTNEAVFMLSSDEASDYKSVIDSITDAWQGNYSVRTGVKNTNNISVMGSGTCDEEMAADFSAGNLGVYNSSTQTWSAANVAPAFWINMESGGATETGEKTYTITYMKDGTEVTSLPSTETMPTSYVRGSEADSEVEITYKSGNRAYTGETIVSIKGATSGTDYSSCISTTSPWNATIPTSVAENLIITLEKE